jgi:hypothetical protein
MRTNSYQRSDSFNLPLRTPPSSSGHPTPYNPPTRPPASTVTKPGNTKGNRNRDGIATKSTSSPPVVDLTTPPGKERKFGQELDTNAKAPLIQVRRSPRKHKTNISMSQGIRPAPVKPMKPLKSVQKTKTVPKQTKETKKRKNALVGEQTVKLKKARTIATKISMPLAGMETAPKQFVLSRPQLGLSSPTRLQRTSQPAPAVRSSSPPKLTVHFAKRPADSQLPDDITEEEWDAFQSARPTPASKICFCNRPACHGKFKKGEDPQIAQCVSKDCRFRWFHYACLDLSEKGKARWGTLLCSVCRIEREYAEQDEKSGWCVEKLIEYQPVWTKERIETHMPGLGGMIPQTNPYGLGLEIQLAPEYQRQINETGTLGGLQKLGYPQPRPEMLEEAYLHAGAYAELLARRAEEEQYGEWEDETHTDMEEDHDAEVYDEEMDEEL